MSGRVIAIGDIHGCGHALEAVIHEINPQPEDTIISLGDVIDYGRESNMVLDILMGLKSKTNLIAIQGNHEEMLLNSFDNPKVKDMWLIAGGVSTLNSYKFCGDLDVIPEHHLEFIRTFVPYYETDDQIFLHANYDPELDLDEQLPHVLRWTLLEPDDAAPHKSGKRVFMGHTEQRDGELLDLNFCVCLDTYCHGYGWLTAADVETGQTWQASRWGALREGEDLRNLQKAKKMLHPEVALSES